MKEYIVVLSLWKRGHWLEEQLNIFRNQSCPPKEIWLCYGINNENRNFQGSELLNKFDKIKTMEDGGSVFSRFEMASESDDDLFLIIDDDMFPTQNYMENVMQFYIDNEDCIIASSGRIFKNAGLYFPNTTLGSINYSNHNQVHIGTNGWFISKQSIKEMLLVHDRRNYNNGEDIAISFVNLKKRKVKTYVIGQDENMNSDKYKHQRGAGDEALSHSSKHHDFYKQRNEILSFYFRGDF